MLQSTIRVIEILHSTIQVIQMLHTTTRFIQMLHTTIRFIQMLPTTIRAIQMLQSTIRVIEMLHSTVRDIQVLHTTMLVIQMLHTSICVIFADESVAPFVSCSVIGWSPYVKTNGIGQRCPGHVEGPLLEHPTARNDVGWVGHDVATAICMDTLTCQLVKPRSFHRH